jgi:hypothetical protein
MILERRIEEPLAEALGELFAVQLHVRLTFPDSEIALHPHLTDGLNSGTQKGAPGNEVCAAAPCARPRAR